MPNFALRLLTLALVLVLLAPPVVGLYRFFLLAVALLWVFTGVPRRRGRNWGWALGITLAVAAVQMFAPRPALQEGHNLFVTLEKGGQASSRVGPPEVLRRQLPPSVWDEMSRRFAAHYPPERWCPPGFGSCWKNSGVPRVAAAYSSDSLFQRGVKYSRVVDAVDFSSLDDFRGGFVNTMGDYPGEMYMNWFGEASGIARERMPWFVMLEWTPQTAGSRLCWRGDVMWQGPAGDFDLLKNPVRNCRVITALDAGKKVLGLAIGPGDVLEMTFQPEGWLAFWGGVREAVRLGGWLLVLGLLAAPRWGPFGRHLGVWGGVAGYLALTGKLKALAGYHVFFGGDDGLTYEGMGRAMLRRLLEGDWAAFLRGGEDVYYFMPGFRYFRAAEKVVFGDSTLGVLLLLLLLGTGVYRLTKMVLPPGLDGSRRLAGFGLAVFFLTLENFARNAMFGNAEVLGYGAFILGAAMVMESLWAEAPPPSKGTAPALFSGWGGGDGRLMGAGLLLFVAVFTRPNLVPGAGVVLAGAAWWLLSQKRAAPLVWLGLGFAPVLLIPLHNWVFGHRLVLLTAASEIPENLLVSPAVYVQAFAALLHGGVAAPPVALVAAHLYDWAGPYGGRLLVFVPHLLFVIRPPRGSGWPIRVLALAGLAQHGVLFCYHPSGRYAVLAWLISFLVTLAWLDGHLPEGRRLWLARRWDGLAALAPKGLAFVLGFSPADTAGFIRYLREKSNVLAARRQGEGMELKGVDKLKIVYRPWLAPFHEMLPLVRQGSRLLDIGCGHGVFLTLAAGYRQPSALAGIEISPGPLETARQLIPPPGLPMNLKLETYDGKTFPSWVGDYTQVSLIDVLHHVSPQEQQPFLAALFESMGPGAELLLKDIDAGRRILVWVNRLHDRLLSGEMGRELSASACLELLRAAGFECSPVHSRRMLLYPHFTIVARKPQKKGADPA